MTMTTPYRILLVEDDQSISKIITIAMQMLRVPYHLDQASSAEEGLDLWDEQPYDILLTDYNLRGKTGVRLIEDIRKRGAIIPTLLFTAYDSPQTRREAERVQVTKYLEKPFVIEDFVATVRELLQLSEKVVGSRQKANGLST